LSPGLKGLAVPLSSSEQSTILCVNFVASNALLLSIKYIFIKKFRHPDHKPCISREQSALQPAAR
jgi:hypothetical protein